jgi:hypothetical protein
VTPPSWALPVVACALTGTLSSGVTALVLRERMPDVFAARAPFQTAAEQRDLAALLVDPGPPFRADSVGAPVDVTALRGSTTGLQSLGFRRGWVRTWRTSSDRVDAFVLEFAAESGAAGYAGGIGRAANLLIKPVPFVVEGVPGASGLADTVKDRSGHYAQLVVLHRGPRAVLLVFTNAVQVPPPTVLDLARRQYDALAS